MKTKARTRQDDQIIARQLGFLLARGLDRAAALKQLEAAASPDLHHSLEALEKRLEPGSRDPQLSAQFIRRATALGGEPGKALASMFAMSTEARKLADNLYRSLKPGLLYVAVVALFGIFVSLIWLFFVWPQMEQMFAGLNAVIPRITTLTLNLGALGFPLIFFLVFLFGVLLWVLAHLRSRQLSRLEPLRFKLFSSKLWQAGNTWLTLGLCDAFHKAGIQSDAALAEAKELMGTELNGIIERDLALAHKTDTFRDELHYQISDSSRTIDTLAHSGGQRELWILRIFLYVLIAVAIISFYEPIFFMPTAVVGME